VFCQDLRGAVRLNVEVWGWNIVRKESKGGIYDTAIRVGEDPAPAGPRNAGWQVSVPVLSGR